jgi:6-phosphogluconolactonase
MANPQLTICADSDELATLAAASIRRAAASSIAERGRFTLALAGGSTPEKTYRKLASEPPSAIDWSKVFLFFGDERCVGPLDSRSNYRMAHEALLSRAPIPPDHVYAVPTELGDDASCARAYEQTLNAFFGLAPGHMPTIDLILLGLGDDGHTASLFPGASALSVLDAAVTYSQPGTLPPPVDRVTLTFPALNAARAVMFLVAGENKAVAFRDVWQRRSTVRERPAAGVSPESGSLTWLVDHAAARLIDAG